VATAQGGINSISIEHITVLPLSFHLMC
jgi:hypothetical protein